MNRGKWVTTERECRDLLGWHWKPRYEKSHWWLHKYARKRRVHNSVALAMGWPVGVRGAGAAFITTGAEVAEKLTEGWAPHVARGQTFLKRGGVKLSVHPDIAGVLQLDIPGAARALTKNRNSRCLVPARAREQFSAGLKKRVHTKGTRLSTPQVRK